MAATKTFHELIAANKRNSWLLMLMMTGLLTGLGIAFGMAWGNWRAGMFFALLASLLMLLLTWTVGGNMLLALGGAREIAKKDAPQLFNVVEEMAIAAGLPMPRVFVIASDAPNAFATGTSPAQAAVAVTSGLLQKLDRSELQGVIAHEIAHIRNFDIRYSLLMATLAGAVVLLSDLFLRSARWSTGSRRRGKDAGGQALLLVVGLVLAILAPLFATLIQLAMSRQREYLADASAVEFTRNPDGLAAALEKLTADPTPLPCSNATEHMYIVSPKLNLRGGADSWFSTHPPLTERIARLRRLTRSAAD